MYPSIVVVLVLVSIGSSLGQGPSAVEPDVVRIASWNIQTLGDSKLKKENIMGKIRQIINRYDIVQIQEFRCTDKTCVHRVNKLMGILGGNFRVCNMPYTPKGNNQHKEVYLFVYRHSKVVCHGTAELEKLDGAQGAIFARPPTAAMFQARDTHGQLCGDPFFIVGIHTKPKMGITIKEIDALPNAFNTFMNHFQKTQSSLNAGMIMGDFNYAKAYVAGGCGANLDGDTNFEQLIKPTDRTAVKTNNAYDRIYLSTKLYNDQADCKGYIDKGGNPMIVKEVSDHYAVFLCLKFKCPVINPRKRPRPDFPRSDTPPAKRPKLEDRAFDEKMSTKVTAIG